MILVPGPPDEIEIVRWIYRKFAQDRVAESQLARMLNESGVVTDLGRAWTYSTVHQILTNEKYIGHNVYNRISFKLKKKRVANPPEMWIRGNAAFESIVSPDLFQKAQELIYERSRRYSDNELLDQLRALLQRAGHLSGVLIDETEGMASSAAFRHRFGSLVRAYSLISYNPDRDYQFIETNRQLRLMHPRVVSNIIDELRKLGGEITHNLTNDLISVNDEFTVSIVLARSRQKEDGSFRWLIRFDAGLKPDITVAARMDSQNREALDYYLLPRLDMTFEKLMISEDNPVSIDAFCFATLDFFFGMAKRSKISEAA